MKNIKLFSVLTLFVFLAFQACEKIKEAIVITVNVPIEKCHTIIAPQPASETIGYSKEIEIDNTETTKVLDENEVDLSAIKSAAPNELIISIGNPDDTNFEITDVKSVLIEVSTATKAAVKVLEEAIENATVTNNQATFKADTSVDITDYIKEDKITMKVTVFTSADVNEDTELCFKLNNDMRIGLPE